MALEYARANWSGGPATSPAENDGEARTQALLAFHRRYGAICPAPRDAAVDAQGRLRLYALRWALLHAAAIDLVLTVNGALSLGQAELAERQLTALAVAARRARGVVGSVGLQESRLALDGILAGPLERRVQELTATLLNPNLGGRRQLHAGREAVQFEALYELMYSQVATWVTKGSFGQCDGCGGFFPLTHGKQRYCPALQGQKESRCAMRDRSRRRRGGEQVAPLRRAPTKLLLPE